MSTGEHRSDPRTAGVSGNASPGAPAPGSERFLEPQFGVVHHLFTHSHDIIARYSLDGICTYVSPSCEHVVGFSQLELIDRSAYEWVHPGDVDVAAAAHAQVLGPAGQAKAEVRHRTRDGGWVWIESHLQLVRDADSGEPREVMIVGRDVTQRKQFEEELRRSEERWQFALEGSGDGVWDWSVQSGAAFFSPRWKAMLGWDEHEIEHHVDAWARLVHPEDRERVENELQRHLRGETSLYVTEHRLRCKDGGWKWILDRGRVLERDAAGRPLRMVGTHSDIGERKQGEEERQRLEAQMLQSQKLEGLGVLAGGIAHDFNNLLTGIMGHVELALMDLEGGSPLSRRLEKVLIGARRAAELTNQLLVYSGQGAYLPQRLQLCTLVQEMGQLLRVSISRRCFLETDFAAEMPSIEGDVSQLRQMVMNLILNASEAIGDENGTICVSAGTVELARAELDEAVHGRELAPGRFVFFEVADTGCGMDTDTLERIFDPFFSTKFTGRGLGLAAVHGIVRLHKGAIQVVSAPGRGTRLRVLLPPARDASPRPAARP